MNFEININAAAFGSSVTRQAIPIMTETLFVVREIIIEEFGSAKTGRVYRRPSGRYQASAPGEPPAIKSGALLRSISQPQVSRSGNSVIGRLTIAAPHAGFLERGTNRMAPRPFIEPAIDALLKGLNRIGRR